MSVATSAGDYDVALLEGFAQVLAAASVATWRDSGVYAGTETGIVLGGLPQSPTNVLAIASYGITDEPEKSDSVIGLQVTARADGQDPRPTMRLAAKTFDQLHELVNTQLPTGVWVIQCLRQSWVSLGQDSNNRWRTVQNFYVTVHRPSAHRI